MATILHVDMDAFFASVEQAHHPEWRGRPVIVGAGPRERGVVSTCSYEARKFGVHSAMPSRTAYERCPEGIFVPPDMALYKDVSNRAFEVFSHYTPYVEAVSIDEAFLDITGSIRLYGTAEKLGEALRAEVHAACGVTCSVGIAPNRLLAKIGSEEHKPNGLTMMPFEREAIVAFLAPKPIGILWGVGAKTAAQLEPYGIRTCGDIQRMDARILANTIGETAARELRDHAFGISDERVFWEPTEEKSVSREYTFDVDVNDPAVVRAKLLELVIDVGRRFRRQKRWARTARLKLRDAGFNTITRQIAFEHPARDDFAFREKALELFARERIGLIRLVGFGVTNIQTTPDEDEPQLFEDAITRRRKGRERLSETLDALRAKGLMRRDTIHSMLRRCRNWDYCGTGTYLITLVLSDRSRPLFGRLAMAPGDSPACAAPGVAPACAAPGVAPACAAPGDSPACAAIHGRVELSELGRRVEAHFARLGDFSPEIEVLGLQMMPEHLHAVIRVTRRLGKPLGEHLRGFKIGATKIARELGAISAPACSARGHGLFADGFVDTILFDEAAVEKGLAYMRDNPRRLAEKRAHPELFKVVRELEVALTIAGRPESARFAAIGNHALLAAPLFAQVQVSRRDFDYARDARGEPLKDAPPRVSTPHFAARLSELLAAASHGAVLVSPCISAGEREIARRAVEAGARVIVLKNKGFAPLFKPAGRAFDQCAAGRLLMLAPAAWPYLPGKKPITRMDACALNRLAQWICGENAAPIDYKGALPADIDALARACIFCSEP